MALIGRWLASSHLLTSPSPLVASAAILDCHRPSLTTTKKTSACNTFRLFIQTQSRDPFIGKTTIVESILFSFETRVGEDFRPRRTNISLICARRPRFAGAQLPRRRPFRRLSARIGRTICCLLQAVHPRRPLDTLHNKLFQCGTMSLPADRPIQQVQ